MKIMNKKGLAFAAVVLLLAAALFVGAAAGEGENAAGDGSGDAQNANAYPTLTVKENADKSKEEYPTISEALKSLLDSKSTAGGATIEIYGKIIEKDENDEPDGVIKNAKEGWNYTFVCGKDKNENPVYAEIDLSAKTTAGSHINDAGVSKLKFNNLTLTFCSDAAPGDAYRGFQHTGLEEYTDCTINGFFKTYAPTAIFTNCTFNQTTYQYHFWVYGTSTATFTGCTFNNLGKAAKLYNEGYCSLNVTFEDCTFNVTTPGKGKAAIEIDSHYTPITVTIKGDTFSVDDDYKTGLLSGNMFWNNEPNDGAKAGYEHISSMNSATVNFTVKLDANGGSLPSGSESKVVSYCANVVSKNSTDPVIPSDDTEKQKLFKIKGSAYGDLPTPTKAGASFDGWYTEKTGGTKVTAATEIKPEDATPHTLYAHWAAPAEPVAKIGSKEYYTLAEAVAAVPTDSTETTITMLKDYAFEGNAGVTISTEQNIVLDLNGHKISCSATAIGTSAVIDNRGELTIKDSTADSVTKVGAGLIVNGLIDPAKGDATPIPGYATNVIRNQGTFTLESGVLQNVVAESACYALDADSQSNTVSTTINGGKLVAVKTPLRIYCSQAHPNTMVINDGTITGSRHGISFQGSNNAATCSLTINGGTITGGENEVDSDSSLDIWDGSSWTDKTLSITGGKFTQQILFEAVPGSCSITGGNFKSIKAADGVTLGKFITGGIFDTKPDGYIADDYEWDDAAKAVAKVQQVNKETFTPQTDDEKKVPGAPEGTKIEQISDIPRTGSIVITQVSYSASNADPAEKVTAVKETLVSIDVSVYVDAGEGAKTKYTENLGKLVTVKFTIPDNNYNLNELAVYHERSSDHVWEKLNFVNNTPKKLDDDTIEIAVQTTSFSPFTVVQLAPKSSSSSSSQGSSTWLTEPTAQPTATPTAQPTAEPTPSVQPSAVKTPAPATPAPFIGILAGLGAAAAVFGLRRK